MVRPSPAPWIAVALFLGLTAGACASPGGGSAPTGLSPSVTSATYTRADSFDLDIDAGGQRIPVRVTSMGTHALTMAREGTATRFTASLQDFTASSSNPMAPTVTSDGSGIVGPLVFDADDRGRVSVTSLPTVTGPSAQLFDPTGLAHTLFPRFPAEPVVAGVRWSDTLQYESDAGGAFSRTRSVITYTAAGDTVVDGRSYLLIRGESADQLQQSGTNAGTNFSQELSGTGTHRYLWDRGAGLLHSSRVEGTLQGTMTVDVAPGPLGVRARTVTTTFRGR
jgi:hypothetical protein